MFKGTAEEAMFWIVTAPKIRANPECWNWSKERLDKTTKNMFKIMMSHGKK